MRIVRLKRVDGGEFARIIGASPGYCSPVIVAIQYEFNCREDQIEFDDDLIKVDGRVVGHTEVDYGSNQ